MYAYLRINEIPVATLYGRFPCKTREKLARLLRSSFQDIDPKATLSLSLPLSPIHPLSFSPLYNPEAIHGI